MSVTDKKKHTKHQSTLQFIDKHQADVITNGFIRGTTTEIKYLFPVQIIKLILKYYLLTIINLNYHNIIYINKIQLIKKIDEMYKSWKMINIAEYFPGSVKYGWSIKVYNIYLSHPCTTLHNI